MKFTLSFRSKNGFLFFKIITSDGSVVAGNFQSRLAAANALLANLLENFMILSCKLWARWVRFAVSASRLGRPTSHWSLGSNPQQVPFTRTTSLTNFSGATLFRASRRITETLRLKLTQSETLSLSLSRFKKPFWMKCFHLRNSHVDIRIWLSASAS